MRITTWYLWLLLTIAVMIVETVVITEAKTNAFYKTDVTIMAGTNTNRVANEPRQTRKWLETNSWDTAVANWQRGLTSQNGGYSWAAYATGNSVLSITNNGSAWYGVHFVCNKTHVADYPKVDIVEYGIQWGTEYASVLTIDGSTVTNTWQKYSYPHERRSIVTTQRVEIVTTVVTNIVVTVEPKACPACGKCQ